MDMAEVLHAMERKKGEEEEEDEEDKDAEDCESDGMSHIVDVTDMLHDMEQTTDDDGVYGILQTVHMDYLMERKTDYERDNNGILLAVNTVEILHSMDQIFLLSKLQLQSSLRGFAQMIRLICPLPLLF